MEGGEGWAGPFEVPSSGYHLVSLGEVMLRLDPGERRITSADQFTVFEGGGEYNVARGFAHVFGLRTAIVTALVDNEVGRLIEGLMKRGSVDTRYVKWALHDGVGRRSRNGLNFTERGAGVRAPLGVSDRGHTAISQSVPGDFEFAKIFEQGVALLHTGGIFAALGDQTAAVAAEAMTAATTAGAWVSYDLNYRPSLWDQFGGSARAATVNRALLEQVDILFGNEEDLALACGEEVDTVKDELDPAAYLSAMTRLKKAFPRLRYVGTSLRIAKSASSNAWGGLLYDVRGDRMSYVAPSPVQIVDRVGGGDSFASGVLFGLVAGWDADRALSCGVAHGALAMTTPGDTSMATRKEVERVMAGGHARILR